MAILVYDVCSFIRFINLLSTYVNFWKAVKNRFRFWLVKRRNLHWQIIETEIENRMRQPIRSLGASVVSPPLSTVYGFRLRSRLCINPLRIHEHNTDCRGAENAQTFYARLFCIFHKNLVPKLVRTFVFYVHKNMRMHPHSVCNKSGDRCMIMKLTIRQSKGWFLRLLDFGQHVGRYIL